MNLAETIALLPSLTPAELDRLAAAIKALRQFNGKANGSGIHLDEEPDLDFVVNAAASVARSLGADPITTPWQLKEAAKRSGAFRDKLPGLMSWLRVACHTRSQQHALLCLAFKLLHQEMTGYGCAVTARTWIANVHRLKAIVDKAFPGYSEAGLLQWVTEKHR